jgi:glutamate--cysteine ligase
MRGADSLPTDLVCALPALWKGLLYEDHALASAEALASKIRLEDAKAARPEIADRALHAKLGDREVGEYASDLLRIASGGLERLSNLNKSGEDERIHLARLESMVSKRQSPADALLEKIDPKAALVPQLLAHARL